MPTIFQNYNNVPQTSLLSKIANWFIPILCLALFFYAIKSPSEDWDMLGYVASAISLENPDIDYIHQYVYDEFKTYATTEDFKNLTIEDPYRNSMFSDADAFNQQIPYYKIRIIFILLILALTKIGINVYLACHIISAGLTCSGFLAFYYAFQKTIHPLFWLVAPIFFISFSVLKVAQTVTADSLAFFWIGLICYAFMHDRWKAFFILLVLSILVRTDMILLVALFTGYLIVFQTDLRLLSIICALVSAVTYFFINNYFENYGWSTVFYFAFISDMQATHPVEFSSYGVTIEQYLSAVKKNIKFFISNREFLLFEICAFIQLIILLLSQIKNNFSLKTIFTNISNNPFFILTLLSEFYVIIHYVLFPLLHFRFFVGLYMISALGMLSIISSLLEQNNSKINDF